MPPAAHVNGSSSTRSSSSSEGAPPTAGKEAYNNNNKAGSMGGDGERFRLYRGLEAKFSKFHTYSVNIGLHLATTPLGLLGFLCLLNRAAYFLTAAAAVAYVASLYTIVPWKTFKRSAGVSALLLILAWVAHAFRS